MHVSASQTFYVKRRLIALRKPRVLLLVNRWYANGGVEHFIEQLVDETSANIDYTIGSLITAVESSSVCSKIGPILSSSNISQMFFLGGQILGFMKSGDYDAVHIQASNGASFYLSHLAKRAGIPKRIVHSHNGGAEISNSPLKRTVGKACSLLFATSATNYWACSNNAGEYLFPGRTFEVFRNGIDLDRFSFSAKERNEVRSRVGVGEQEFLLGSIGRIEQQKNPIFQVRVFSELLKLIPNAKFCIVGNGSMENELNNEVSELGLWNHIIRVSSTSEPQSFYSAFDALLLPSRFEGLSFVGIEAQCSGLPIYGSRALPRELGITKLITFDSIQEDPAVWAKRIANGIGRIKTEERANYSAELYDLGFDRKTCFEKIAGAYQRGASVG